MVAFEARQTINPQDPRRETMSQRAEELSKRIEAFRNDVIAFVEKLSPDDWQKTCEWEAWTVGTTACHLGGGHLAISGLLDMMVRGEPLPQLTMDDITAMANKGAREHARSTKTDALALLRENGAQLAARVAALGDDDLDRKGSMPAFGGEVSAGQLIDYVIFQSGGQHLASMKAAVGR
jgi:hypothetical protein